MIKKIYIFILSFFCIFLIAACGSHSATSSSPVSTSRADLYSNTLLSPNEIHADSYFPLNKTLVSNIRAVGGEVYQSGSFVTIVIPADALFEPSTSVMLLNADKLIVDVAKIIVRFPHEQVIITAHTDNIGSEFSQAKLTRTQAQLFAIMLWQQDAIDLKTFQRFKYAGMADSQPITDDPSPHGQALNRRVQVTVYPTKDMEEAYQALGNPDLYQV